MKIAELRSVLEFQIEKETPNDTYGVDLTWATIFKVRGNVKTVSGDTWSRGASEEPNTTHIITIRHDSRFKRGMRIAHGNVNYTIHKAIIDEQDKKKYWLLSVEQEEVLI